MLTNRIRPLASITGFFLFAACVSCPAQLYTISTFAGGAPLRTPAPALNQPLAPLAVTLDSAGNFYFPSGNCIFRTDQTGVMTRIAGNSRPGYLGDGGPALTAELNQPSGLAFDSAGNLLIADSGNYRIRKISTAGIITTMAGSGASANTGDGGPAVSAGLRAPTSIAVDAPGNVYIGDNVWNLGSFNVGGEVRKVSANGIIAPVPTSTPLSGAAGLAVDSAGNLYIADIGNLRVVEVVAATGATVTVAGNGGPPATAVLVRPYSLVIDSAGNIYVGDQGQLAQSGHRAAIWKVSPGGAITNLAGGGNLTSPTPAVPLENSAGIALDASGNLYVADGPRILELTPAGTAPLVAGSNTSPLAGPAGDGGPATSAQLALPGIQGVGELSCLAIDSAGNLYVSENSLGRVRKVTPAGIITTYAGNGTQSFSPASIAVDASGNLYITNNVNATFLKVTPDGTLSTLFSWGIPRYSVTGLAADAAGDLYFTDGFNYLVRKLSVAGVVTTIAGTGQPGFSGDGGSATSAQLNQLGGIALDAAGNVYISDSGRLRKISTTGIITTVAGNGNLFLDVPVVDSAGNIYFTEAAANLVQKLSPNGTITTIAGTGQRGYSGDGGPAIAAQMILPYGIAVDSSGNLYISDTANNAVRILRPTNQPSLISAVVDAASETALSASPGKIVAIYGAGFGSLPGTTVAFNGISAPVIYSTATQIAAVVPYEVSGATAQVIVTYQGETTPPFTIPLSASSPALFTLNETGAGQAAAVNLDGSINTAANPVHVGSYLSLYATGEGQTSPPGVDGKIAALPLPQPVLPVSVSIGGQPALVTYYGGAPGEIAGLMQVNVLIPPGIQPGGYVPVVLTVGNTAAQPGVTIAVAAGN